MPTSANFDLDPIGRSSENQMLSQSAVLMTHHIRRQNISVFRWVFLLKVIGFDGILANIFSLANTCKTETLDSMYAKASEDVLS